MPKKIEIIPLTGQKIVEVRDMTKDELDAQDWGGCPWAIVIVLESGTKIFASQDSEGNGPGCMFGENEKGNGFYVTPEK
jgi:hypothetical protein